MTEANVGRATFAETFSLTTCGRGQTASTTDTDITERHQFRMRLLLWNTSGLFICTVNHCARIQSAHKQRCSKTYRCAAVFSVQRHGLLMARNSGRCRRSGDQVPAQVKPSIPVRAVMPSRSSRKRVCTTRPFVSCAFES